MNEIVFLNKKKWSIVTKMDISVHDQHQLNLWVVKL